MAKKNEYVHAHHIGSHFTNGLWPVGLLFLVSYFITGKASYESASFYCFIISTIGSPIVFFSGYFDWRTRFQARSVRIFNHKRFFGVLFMVVSLLLVVWRFVDPSIAGPENSLRYLYLGFAFINLGFVTYLGYLGGKLI